MGLIQIAITLALALFVRRQWPGLAWLAFLVATDLAAYAFLDSADPRLKTIAPHLLIHTMGYAATRAIRRWKEEGDGHIWAIGAWQIGSISTFGFLTFFDGTDYNWWNWIIIVPVNGFVSEIWPIYWLLLRPVMG